MDERPQDAVRRKKDSSMRVAINLVKKGEAAACVSAGNTGALLATARFVLGMVPGIDRPAIVSAVPAAHGHTVMLDLGANPDCTAEHLVQFAVMGSVIASDLHGVDRPRVGLLNIGEEDIKGTDEIARGAPPPRPRRRSTTSASSRATSSSRATWTWWSPTASPATSRSRPWKGWRASSAA